MAPFQQIVQPNLIPARIYIHSSIFPGTCTAESHMCGQYTREAHLKRVYQKTSWQAYMISACYAQSSSMQEAPSPIYATFPGTGESQIDSGYTAQAGKQKLTITTRYSNWGLRATLQAIQGDTSKLDRSPTFPTHILKTTCLFSAPSHALCSTCS
jgi:hypothetical protein